MSSRSTWANGEILYYPSNLHNGILSSLGFHWSCAYCQKCYVHMCKCSVVSRRQCSLGVIYCICLWESSCPLWKKQVFENSFLFKSHQLISAQIHKDMLMNTIEYFIYLQQIYNIAVKHKYLKDTGTDCSNTCSWSVSVYRIRIMLICMES